MHVHALALTSSHTIHLYRVRFGLKFIFIFILGHACMCVCITCGKRNSAYFTKRRTQAHRTIANSIKRTRERETEHQTKIETTTKNAVELKVVQ